MLKPLLAFIPLLLVPTHAAAQSIPIPIERPGFCAGHKPDPGRKHYASSLENAPLTSESVGRVALYACDAPDDPARQNMLADYRRRMVVSWGISVQGTNASFGARLDLAAWNHEIKAYCGATDPQSTDNPRTGRIEEAWHTINACADSASLHWIIDEEAEAPQVWRFAMARSCYPSQDLETFAATFDSNRDMLKMYRLSKYAYCAADVQALDRAKLVAELDQDRRVTPRVKINILENFDQTKAWTGMVTAAYVAAAKKNPDIKAVAFDEPMAAAAGWQQRYAGMKADFDVVLELERLSSNGNRAAKGCAARLRPVLPRLLAGSKLKTMSDVKALDVDPFVNRALRALAYCEELDGNPSVGACLHPQAAPPRGPRGVAMLAAAKKVHEIRNDEPAFADGKILFHGTGSGLPFKGTKRCTMDVPAVIKEVKKTGDAATITFKSESRRVMSHSCRDTKKVMSVNPVTGVVNYYQECKDTGMITVTTTPKPLATLAAYTTGLAAGQLLIVGRDGDDAGLPYVGLTDATGTQLSSVYGLKP